MIHEPLWQFVLQLALMLIWGMLLGACAWAAWRNGR
jgi:hypothetical protein